MGDSPAEAFVVLDRGGPAERRIPVYDRLFVGREAPTIDEGRYLMVAHPAVSRHHLEVRLDPAADAAWVVDTSTNGTRINGARIERAVPHPLRPGDVIRVGETELWFESERYRALPKRDSRQTLGLLTPSRVVLTVGDIVGYSTISEYTADETLASSLDRLYQALRELLREQRGTFVNYQGDAFFAVWELDGEGGEDAPHRAVEFCLRAAHRMAALAPELPLRDPDGSPIRMGWAVVMGEGAVGSLTGTPFTVLGDTANLAFRLSGVAGRDGRHDVVVTDAVADAVTGAFRFGDPEKVVGKGRVAPVMFQGVLGSAD